MDDRFLLRFLSAAVDRANPVKALKRMVRTIETDSLALLYKGLQEALAVVEEEHRHRVELEQNAEPPKADSKKFPRKGRDVNARHPGIVTHIYFKTPEQISKERSLKQ